MIFFIFNSLFLKLPGRWTDMDRPSGELWWVSWGSWQLVRGFHLHSTSRLYFPDMFYRTLKNILRWCSVRLEAFSNRHHRTTNQIRVWLWPMRNEHFKNGPEWVPLILKCPIITNTAHCVKFRLKEFLFVNQSELSILKSIWNLTWRKSSSYENMPRVEFVFLGFYFTSGLISGSTTLTTSGFRSGESRGVISGFTSG